MKRERNYSSISIYDKTNNLITYLERTPDNDVKSFFEVKNNVLNRKFLSEYDEDYSCTELSSSIVSYSEPVKLFPITQLGETLMKVIPSGETTTFLNSAEIKSTINTIELNEQSTVVDRFTVDSGLINNYLNKLDFL